MVQLQKEEVDKEAAKWNCALIAYFVGDTPGYNALNRYIRQYWTNVADPELYYHEEGYYVIRFASVEVEDMKEVLYSGPYTINNRPIILKPWSMDFDFSTEHPTKIPLCRLNFPSS